MLSLLHRYYGPLRLPSRSSPFHLFVYRSAPYGPCCRAGEGLPSSKHNCPRMPFPIHRRVLPCCFQVLRTFHGLRPTSRGSALSCPFRVEFDDAAGFTSYVTACGLASPCPSFLTRFFAGLQSAGSRRRLPASYGVAWSLPRPDFHRLVMPSLARRAKVEITAK